MIYGMSCFLHIRREESHMNLWAQKKSSISLQVVTPGIHTVHVHWWDECSESPPVILNGEFGPCKCMLSNTLTCTTYIRLAGLTTSFGIAIWELHVLTPYCYASDCMVHGGTASWAASEYVSRYIRLLSTTIMYIEHYKEKESRRRGNDEDPRN